MKLKKIAFFKVILLVSILIFEGGLRILTPFPVHGPKANRIRDAKLNHRMDPDFEGIDESGFRNPTVPTKAEIVALGDSHTYGYNVASDDTGGMDDPEQYSAGLNLGFGGFTVGGSIGIEESDRATDGTAYDFGASYGTGPWTVALTYFHSEVEGANNGGGEDELDAYQAGISYAVGPGITASANVLYAEWDGEAGVDADGLGGILGLNIGF